MIHATNELILVIDGDEDCRIMYGQLLRHHGYRPVVAASAEEAFDAIGDTCPAVIVVETHLPDADGGETANRIARHCTKPVPIIAVSARVTLDQLHRTKCHGFARVLLKPFPPVVLVHTVNALLHATPANNKP